jgi:nitroreductase
MDVKEAIVSRRTVHSFLPDAIDKDQITEALEAALMAPNHRMTCPWRFIQVGKKGREQLADLAVRLKAKSQELSEVAQRAVREKSLEAPVLIVFGQRRSSDPRTTREDYASLACAVQNFSLSLWSHGVGTKWSSGEIIRHPETYKLLGIDSQEIDIVGFIWIGRPRQVPQPQRRPQLSEVFNCTP